jgi:Zn-dependent protease
VWEARLAPDGEPVLAASACPQCGTQLAPSLLSCPSCKSLVHAARLKSLAAEAEAVAATGNPSGSAAKWREALELLPPGTRQFTAIEAKLSALGREIDRIGARGSETGAPEQSWLKRGWVVLVAGGLFLLSKGKLLLVGLTKWKTLLSMLAFMGVYIQLWGWKFALGFVVGIYIHEMGHVAALRRYGIAATAPMFIPGLGAYVRLKQHLTDVRQDARVGLAGPIWGLAAGMVAYGVGLATDSQIWFAIAQSTAFINLFNLVPFWQLDGGRGFHALTQPQRWLAVGVIGGAWMLTHQGLLLLLLILAVVQAFRSGAREPDSGALATYAGLVVVLTWLMGIPVAGAGPSG